MNEKKNDFYDLSKMAEFKKSFNNRGDARDQNKQKADQKKKSVYDSMSEDKESVKDNYRKPW